MRWPLVDEAMYFYGRPRDAGMPGPGRLRSPTACTPRPAWPRRARIGARRCARRPETGAHPSDRRSTNVAAAPPAGALAREATAPHASERGELCRAPRRELARHPRHGWCRCSDHDVDGPRRAAHRRGAWLERLGATGPAPPWGAAGAGRTLRLPGYLPRRSSSAPRAASGPRPRGGGHGGRASGAGGEKARRHRLRRARRSGADRRRAPSGRPRATRARAPPRARSPRRR